MLNGNGDDGGNSAPFGGGIDTWELIARILTSYVTSNAISPSDLVSLARELKTVFATSPSELKSQVAACESDSAARPQDLLRPRSSDDLSPASAAQQPAVPIDQSVHEDFIISLEDGKHFRSLRRHLMAKYKMTPDEYRIKWNLPVDYPMVAPSYARDRSEVAKRTGLGRFVSGAPLRRASSSRKT